MDQCEVDAKVRGRLLANAAMAEVRQQYVHSAPGKQGEAGGRKLHMEWEVSQSPGKVQM